jgi:hypothetical protein
MPADDYLSSAADLGSRFTSGMHLQFCQDSLGMVPGGVLADPQLARNDLVGTPLTEEPGHLRFAPGQSKLLCDAILVFGLVGLN